jgi:hypothetical protein
VLLVVDVTLGRTAGIAAGAGTLAVCVLLWGVLPRLVRRTGVRTDQPVTEGPTETPSDPGSRDSGG